MTYGARSAPAAMYLCSAEGQPVTSPFPPVWISDRDASDPAAGVHCQLVQPPFAGVAAKVFRTVARIAGGL